jgi:hypothetical protein
VVWAAASCGSSARPPQEGLLALDASAGSETGTTFQNTPPTALSCNLGPDGGVCACADQPLLGDPPTLYFVLDRSASMLDDDKWRKVITVLGSLVVDLGPRAVIGAAVFPDPQTGGQCSPGIEVFPPMRGDAPAGHVGPVETAFLTQLDGIPANGGTPTAATLAKLAPALEARAGKTYVILATDGGPNCNASAACGADMCEINIESSPSSPCPPGGYNCCADPMYGTSLSCLDAEPTVAAVADLAAHGIPVYVVGVPGSAPYAALLDELARAGMTDRGSEPAYYAVDTADVAAFTSAIFGIAAAITGTCTLTLNDVPPDPAQVNVFIDEQVLPQEGADGWTLDGETVTILGRSCDAIRTGQALDVRVVAGCPTLYR